jgi:hypothetical protein
MWYKLEKPTFDTFTATGLILYLIHKLYTMLYDYNTITVEKPTEDPVEGYTWEQVWVQKSTSDVPGATKRPRVEPNQDRVSDDHQFNS